MYRDIIDLKTKIAVVGLGYVGLPIAYAFSKCALVIGFDNNKEKIDLYKNGKDITKEVGDNEISTSKIDFTNYENRLKEASFIVVAVPTPINEDKTPDLNPLIEASKIIGRNLNKGSIVSYESTVYPGVTEDICVPVLEEVSGLKCGVDFNVGYSPERINPADKIHKFDNIKKVISANNAKTLEEMKKIYELVVKAGTFSAKSIKVAEAAKLVENSQRDINIAFMNEVAKVFNLMDIESKDVIEAMSTKWNFLKFEPGLVGGHCVGVDPYYFVYNAQKLGYNSQIVLAGRQLNDSMGDFVASNILKLMIKTDINVRNAKIYIMGASFKENTPDIRNSKVEDIINYLLSYNIEPILVEPVVDEAELAKIYNIKTAKLGEVKDADCIVFAVAHDQFKELEFKDIENMFKSSENNKKIVIDIKNILDSEKFKNNNYIYWTM